jgi:low temperature requirement protein LtrA
MARIASPNAMSRSQRRRRDVLLILGVAVLSTLLLAVVAGNPLFYLVQAFTDVMLVGYLALLVRMKQTENERKAKVHYLPAPAPAPSLVLRRSSVSS